MEDISGFFCSSCGVQFCSLCFLLYPSVFQEYIVFVTPSIRPSVRPLIYALVFCLVDDFTISNIIGENLSIFDKIYSEVTQIISHHINTAAYLKPL